MPLIESGAALLKSLVPENDDPRRGTRGNDRDPAKALQDSQKALRDMLSTDPKGATGRPRDGYGAKERRDMERLLESSK